MSYPHLSAVAPLELGNPTAKLVLYQMANVACEECGLVWTGISYLSKMTGLGPTAVRGGLKWLVSEGWIRAHHYTKGGRERATEYIVMPEIMELSTAPCVDCAKRMKRHRNVVGIEENATTNPPAGDGYKTKPTAKQAQYPPRGGDHTVNTHTQSGASRPVENSPPARLDPSSDPPDPTPWAENAAQARRLADLFGPTPRPKSPATGKDAPQNAATAPAREEPQGNGQADGLELGSEAGETEPD